MDPLSAAASVIAVVQLTATIVQLCGVYASKVKDAKQDILRLGEEVDALRKILITLHEFMSGPDGADSIVHDDLLANIARCFTTLSGFEKKLDLKTTQKAIRRKLHLLKWPLEQGEADRVIEHIERKTARILDRKLDFGTLRTAKGAAFDSYDNLHKECLPGTRVELLDEIERWATAQDGKCIFWLNGMAGTGKSTISRTIASRLKRQGLLGASFFFKKGEEDRGTAKKLFPTLVEQLVIGLPDMVSGVQAAIKDDPNISEKVLREQFEKLFLHPLLEIGHNWTKTITKVIVVDALDECDQEESIRHLLRLLPQVHQSSSVQIRFLLTSRPELPIRLGFSSISTDVHQDLVLHEIPEPVVRHDISLYIENRLALLRQERSLPLDWPGEEATRALVEKAIPLFISAFTLCLFIGDENWIPEKRLRAILADETTYLSKMDGIYQPVLHQLLTGQEESESQQLVQEFKEIIGVIILLATPLSVNSLSRLLEMSKDDINIRLRRLHSVLNIPNDTEKPVRLLHLSFRDWLLNPKKENSTFWIDEQRVHRTLTTLCLQNMKKNLRKNICELPSDGKLRKEIDMQSVDNHLPSDLRYSCRYWIHHLVQTKEPAADVSGIFSFLEEQFLHWIEVMSILGFLSEAISMLALLQSVVQDPEMSDNIRDMRRFVLRNRHIADVAPLQLYASGLIFSPELSFVRKTFSSEFPDWFLRPPKIRQTWTAEIQTLEDHFSSVGAVAFSPDSKVLATGSRDHTIKLWDTTTGALQQTLKGHSRSVIAVEFSPDGQSLVSGSDDHVINVWDISTGALQHSHNDYTRKVRTMNISPNGHLIASGTNHGTVWLWDANTRAMRQTLESHTEEIETLSFSPDGQLLASGSCDETIKLWNTSTGTLKDTLKGHVDWVLTVAFSPNGTLLASGSRDGTINLWVAATLSLKQTMNTKGYPQQTATYQGRSVVAVAISTNSRVLASSSGDRILMIWDVTTGAVLQVLEGHMSTAWAVRFSQDGQMLASGSHDGTAKLWDITTGFLGEHMQQNSPTTQLNAEAKKIPIDHSGQVIITTISPNGQILASGSVDYMVKLWSVTTGALLKTLPGHQDWVDKVAFSPNNQLLASSSRDGIIMIWGVTGDLRHTLDRQLDMINTMVFSPDSRLLASGCDDCTVKIWDTAYGTLTQSLAVKECVRYMTFSPHGGCLETDQGSLDIQFEYENSHPDTVLADSRSMSLINGWVYLDGVRLLWLPFEYRPMSWDSTGCTIALGYYSGDISFMEFRPW
ncbi:WD40 repeat-like protein [Aspergillus campestris IBT 28561]|uniref:WD40 repeat-like protein n=1 Tax=Aspergillus campestris (strain IBT 28561) TaxID=1392248 RepID=A0A2I1D056_ASPC2|nr:WD40 repeat-like protein [Aspergillus campestris IBT 28561]PKY03251.1 WD40 repeat-like protein [Aspergillus campestris IBT 28561]